MARRGSVAGVVLIVLGVLFLLGQWTGVGGEGLVALIGAAFLAAYALTRNYGLLVPGGIMTGLGVGIIYQDRLDGEGTPVLLGLGLGFAAIYLVDRAVRRAAGGWWPLVPGAVLTLIGLLQAGNQSGLQGALGRWWPLALVLLGLYLIFRRRGGPTGAG